MAPADLDIAKLNETVREESLQVQAVVDEIRKSIVGQKALIERMMVTLLCRGHLLVEGVPGLAKTLAVKTLGQVLDLHFARIQFTPDLLPADLIGTMIYQQKTGEFVARKGPVFTNLLLADEVNRAPAKVQSALLEAMQERQVTLGETSHPLPEPFLVFATQNPIEQEGTYPLPEAQVDRFLLKVRVDYPRREEERQILDRMMSGEAPALHRVLKGGDVVRLSRRVREVYLDERIRDYIVALVTSTRRPDGDQVFETYETKWRGIEAMLPTLQLLDLTPYGRQESRMHALLPDFQNHTRCHACQKSSPRATIKRGSGISTPGRLRHRSARSGVASSMRIVVGRTGW